MGGAGGLAPRMISLIHMLYSSGAWFTLDAICGGEVMVDFSILLNCNLLYAEHPFSEIGNMVEKSYVPVLKMILAKSGTRRRTPTSTTGCRPTT